MAKELKFRKDGLPDGRGRSPGSQRTQFASEDGRRRPGRRKGSKSLSTIYRAIADTLVTITKDGRQRRITRKEAIVLKEALLAMQGDSRAREGFLRRLQESSPPEVEADRTAQLLKEDQEILRQAVDRGLIDPTEKPPARPDHGDGSGEGPEQ